MVIIGAVSFVTTLLWWIVPLTLAAYAAVVFFDIRSPLFQSRVLDRTRRRSETRVEPLGDRNIFLERRARLQLRRKSCQKVESAREAQQQVIVAIEGTGASTKLILDGAVAELYCVAESAS